MGQVRKEAIGPTLNIDISNIYTNKYLLFIFFYLSISFIYYYLDDATLLFFASNKIEWKPFILGGGVTNI